MCGSPFVSLDLTLNVLEKLMSRSLITGYILSRRKSVWPINLDATYLREFIGGRCFLLSLQSFLLQW